MPNKLLVSLFLKTGADAKQHREALGMTQVEFWGRICVSQSAASRYECGGSMPLLVQQLLHIAYAHKKDAMLWVRLLRTPELPDVAAP